MPSGRVAVGILTNVVSFMPLSCPVPVLLSPPLTSAHGVGARRVFASAYDGRLPLFPAYFACSMSAVVTMLLVGVGFRCVFTHPGRPFRGFSVSKFPRFSASFDLAVGARCNDPDSLPQVVNARAMTARKASNPDGVGS